jgi:asparagine synthetase B (glutamine-hydrolysing)
MIVDRDRLFRDIQAFRWEGSDIPFAERVGILEAAIDTALLHAWENHPPGTERLHMAFSGGVDSSSLLMRAVALGLSVTTHTLGTSEEYPDIVYARQVRAAVPGVEGHEHLEPLTPEDTERSNSILGIQAERPDMYLLLMQAVLPHTKTLVCGDVIDELLGGYYAHRAGDEATFARFLGQLIPGHLEPLDRISSALGIQVHVPYGHPDVLQACSLFRPEELAGPTFRKRAIFDVASRNGVPAEATSRRKRGLITAKALLDG